MTLQERIERAERKVSFHERQMTEYSDRLIGARSTGASNVKLLESIRNDHANDWTTWSATVKSLREARQTYEVDSAPFFAKRSDHSHLFPGGS